MSSLVDTSKGRTAQIVVDELRSQSLSEIEVWINGTKHRIEEPDPEMTLLEYLRNVARLTGTKLGCGEVRVHPYYIFLNQKLMSIIFLVVLPSLLFLLYLRCGLVLRILWLSSSRCGWHANKNMVFPSPPWALTCLAGLTGRVRSVYRNGVPTGPRPSVVPRNHIEDGAVGDTKARQSECLPVAALCSGPGPRRDRGRHW